LRPGRRRVHASSEASTLQAPGRRPPGRRPHVSTPLRRRPRCRRSSPRLSAALSACPRLFGGVHVAGSTPCPAGAGCPGVHASSEASTLQTAPTPVAQPTSFAGCLPQARRVRASLLFSNRDRVEPPLLPPLLDQPPPALLTPEPGRDLLAAGETAVLIPILLSPEPRL